MTQAQAISELSRLITQTGDTNSYLVQEFISYVNARYVEQWITDTAQSH